MIDLYKFNPLSELGKKAINSPEISYIKLISTTIDDFKIAFQTLYNKHTSEEK